MTERDTSNADGSESNETDGLSRRHALAALGGLGLIGVGSQSATAGSGDHLGETWTGTADPGLKVEIDNAGTALEGESTATSESFAFGVMGRTSSQWGRAVGGFADNDSGSSLGVLGRNQSRDGTGVRGYAESKSGSTVGVKGNVESTEGRGVVGVARASSGTTYGVYGRVNSSDGYGLYTPDDAKVDGTADVATADVDSLTVTSSLTATGLVDSDEIAADSVGTSELNAPFADLATLFGTPVAAGGDLDLGSNDVSGVGTATASAVNADSLGDAGSGDVTLQSSVDVNGNNVRSDGSVTVDVDTNSSSSSESFTVTQDGGTRIFEVGESGSGPGNVVAGHPGNGFNNSPVGATISGGGNDSNPNVVSAKYGTIGGGRANQISDNDSTIAGGRSNEIGDHLCFVGGGGNNQAGVSSTNSYYATVAGGDRNKATARFATVPGGTRNVADGYASFAAGREAKTNGYDGAVVFGDSTSTAVQAQNADEFRSQMPMYAPSFNTTSASAAKTNVEPFDPGAALDGVESLEVNTWEFTDTDDGRHVGPMAEDFHDAFDLEDDGESIATVDADGVAFAAIKGLADRLEAERKELEDENEQLREELAAKDDRIDQLEDRLARLESEVGVADGSNVVADD